MSNFRDTRNSATYKQGTRVLLIDWSPQVFQTTLLLVMAESVPFSIFKHPSAQVRGKCLLYRGWMQDTSEETKRLFDSVSEPYRKEREASGEAPDGVKYQICASDNKLLYTYGGWGEDKAPVKSLHQLNTENLRWCKLSSGTSEEEPATPMAKHSGGMIAFGKKLALLGGYGRPHNSNAIQRGSDFTADTNHNDGGGWTNEFHIYSLEEGYFFIFLSFWFHSFLLYCTI